MNKNKTIFMLLLVPFIISIISFVSVRIVYNNVAADIIDIEWKYAETEGFKVGSEPYLLEAKPIVDDNLLLADGNELIWYVEGNDDTIVEIKESNDQFYLYAKKEGSVNIICSNERKTKSKYFEAFVFENSAIVINPTRKGSGEKIDETRYYGEYNFIYKDIIVDTYSKTHASFDVDVKTFGTIESYKLEALSSNIEIINGNTIKFKDGGDASIRARSTSAPYTYSDYTFKIIDDACNIYSYNDLLMATNFSSEGEDLVLQTNFESLKNTYKYDETNEIYLPIKLKENTSLFGNYDFKEKTFNFKNEYYTFESVYNTDYIDQYNKERNEKNSKDIRVGINLKSNLYGNGFSINMHELAYPTNGKIGISGKIVPDRTLDNFFGPLSFVSIGNLEENPIVKAYGQDNIGLYVNNDNLTINDVRIKNSNELNNMYDLTYCGSVVEVNGSSNTIKNSVLSNGRVVLRTFNADRLLVSNSIIKNANEFLCLFSSLNPNSYDTSKTINTNFESNIINKNFNSFMNDDDSLESANYLLNNTLSKGIITDNNEINNIYDNLMDIQDLLDNDSNIYNSDNSTKYAYTSSFKDTSFYNSGVFSIAFESYFNGPYLYSGLPSLIRDNVVAFDTVIPSLLGKTSLPVALNIDNSNRFYDWKDINSLDVGSLVEENISYTINNLYPDKDVNITIDHLYPIKPVLTDIARNRKYIYSNNGKKYINTKIAWYGGGLNKSNVMFEDDDLYYNNIVVDLIKPMLSGKYAISKNPLFSIASNAILMATGFNPYVFNINDPITDSSIPKYFGQVPIIEDLMKN